MIFTFKSFKGSSPRLWLTHYILRFSPVKSTSHSGSDSRDLVWKDVVGSQSSEAPFKASHEPRRILRLELPNQPHPSGVLFSPQVPMLHQPPPATESPLALGSAISQGHAATPRTCFQTSLPEKPCSLTVEFCRLRPLPYLNYPSVSLVPSPASFL